MKTINREIQKCLHATNLILMLYKLKVILSRPKHEMELILILRRIIFSLEELNANIIESCQSKLVLWENKQMKSRNRESYKRMLHCIPNLQYGIGCVFHAMFVTLKELQKYEADVVKKSLR